MKHLQASRLATGVLLLFTAFAGGFAENSIGAENPLRGNIARPSLDPLQSLANAYRSVIQLPKIQLKLSRPELHSLTFDQRITGQEIDTTKFQHYFQGLEVVGSQAFHHVTAQGIEISDQVAKFDVSIRPTLDSERAAQLARSFIGDRSLLSQPELKVFPRNENEVRLVYWMKLASNGIQPGREVVVDAHSGELVASMSFHLPIAPVDVYSTLGKTVRVNPDEITSKDQIDPTWKEACQLVDSRDGTPLMLNHKACAPAVSAGRVIGGTKPDASAARAAANAARVLEYFKSSHNRDSFDNRGTRLVSLVHVGEKFGNAFWDTQDNYMGYGDGDGKTVGDFTLALDVAGHEMTHGVVTQTANFVSMDESGALNEAYADFFGLLISGSASWQIGKEVSIADGAPIRNLADPSSQVAAQRRTANGQIVNVKYPAHIDNKVVSRNACDDSNDNCFVHVNATIPGHASYLIFKTIGKEKAEKLYYTVLTQRLGRTATFVRMAEETRKACQAMYDAKTCAQVSQSFSVVGL